MENEQQFSNLIYEFFVIRFRFGYYKYGDLLPPADTLCHAFCVAEQTVKAALRRLRAEGYIDMGSGRTTSVLFHQQEQELQDFIAGYYAKRWDAYSDLSATAGLILVPLLVEGLRRMTEENMDFLYRMAEEAGPNDLLHYYCVILQRIENPLAMNFFWEVLLFLGYPFAKPERRPTKYDAENTKLRLRTLFTYAREQRWNCVHDTFLQFQEQDYRTVSRYLEKNITPAPKEEQLPFVWRIYRDHPQICYNLAAYILHEIYIGKYRDTRFLPSYGEMAKIYGVSVSTVRRMIAMLNRMGAVQSIKGKGTRIYPMGEHSAPPNFTDPTIRRNLSFYVQSLELVLYTCESVTRAFLPALSSGEKERLTGQLKDNLRSGHCNVSLLHLLFCIASHSRLQGIRGTYGLIYTLFLWGSPLKDNNKRTPELDQAEICFTESVIRCLEDNDAGGCAAAFRQLVTEQLPSTENYLSRQGITSKELRFSPAIRFLFTDT